MLTELGIRNFAVIEEENISFGPGLNVITGETGSGKSILLQALEFLLGARAKTDLIRKGSERFELHAIFDLSDIPQDTRNSLPEFIDSEELLISRTLDTHGKGKIYLNGRPATLSLLQQITEHLVNICSQGQQVQLLKPASHVDYIDAYANHEPLLKNYGAAYQQWMTEKKKLDQLIEKRETDALRLAELQFVVEELGGADIIPGVRKDIETQIQTIARIEETLQVAGQVENICTEEDGILSRFQALQKHLRELSGHSSKLRSLPKDLEIAMGAVDEILKTIQNHCRSLDCDNTQLEQLRDRLSEIASLERKYRRNDEGLIQLLQEAEKELHLLSDADALDQLEKEVLQYFEEAQKLGKKLQQSRQKAAKKLSSEVQSNLKELNMPGASIDVKFKETDPSPGGVDQLQFLFCPHAGEDHKPLSAIASGGELSRILLVLKKVLREKHGVNVLVFDEVDTGISGKVARAVGEKLQELSRGSQVLCITHLAQVASLADRHLLVVKNTGKDTRTSIELLSNEQRIDEVARMLSGHEVTKKARESAKELIVANR